MSLIKLELYTQGEDVKYKGRLLGLITNEEFNALIDSKEVQNKIYTKGTLPLTDIMGLTDVEDMRLVMTVRKRGEKEVPAKTLFVSDKITMLTYESNGKAEDGKEEVIINTASDECLFVKEVENLL